MSQELKALIKQTITKLACDGDSESILLAINLEHEMSKHKTFIEMLEGE